ncbi:hypothetical protein G4B88_006722 [Cannabis sativa]|uniref:glutathione transferase n=1 Tax=Cannabis sativa TaxID=3483 RepID=A0A7J6GU36_CANSA|nr:hypothetical protein G4B88_006722 [Cannabis sativa]
MAPIKVHGSAYSTATMRVIATLNEKNLDFELVPVDMRTGEHKKEPFISLNVNSLLDWTENSIMSFEPGRSRSVSCWVEG